MTSDSPGFDSLSTPGSPDGDVYPWDIPDQWQQGRGAFGGLVVAALIRATQARVTASNQPLRSLTATLCGPALPGACSLETTLLRRGRNTTAASVLARQGDGVFAQATALFGARRVEDGDWNHLHPPKSPDWTQVPVAPVQPPLAPIFTQHVEFRLLSLPPGSGADDAHGVVAWVRLKNPGEARDPAYLAALVDTPWPALMPRLKSFRPMATVSYALEVLGDWDGLDPDAPLLYRAVSPIAADGYAVEQRELWGHDGRIMAFNQQRFAIIK